MKNTRMKELKDIVNNWSNDETNPNDETLREISTISESAFCVAYIGGTRPNEVSDFCEALLCNN